MIDSVLALAFTSGMVAAFNPCGFSLLPAYVGAFVVGDDIAAGTDRRVLRAVGVAAAVSAGFVVVFSTIGAVIDVIAGGLQERLPWVTIVAGVALAVTGAATIAGWRPRLAVNVPRPTRLPASRLLVMAGYGVTYAIASLSCTIGPFLAVTGVALTASPWGAATAYLAYAVGMGSVILAVSLAAALAHTTVTTRLRRVSRAAAHAAGVLMVLAGAYAVWYGRWELAVYDGELRRDPLIGGVERIRLSIVAEIIRIGAGRLALATLVVTVVVAGVAARHRAARAARDDAGPEGIET